MGNDVCSVHDVPFALVNKREGGLFPSKLAAQNDPLHTIAVPMVPVAG